MTFSSTTWLTRQIGPPVSTLINSPSERNLSTFCFKILGLEIYWNINILISLQEKEELREKLVQAEESMKVRDRPNRSLTLPLVQYFTFSSVYLCNLLEELT